MSELASPQFATEKVASVQFPTIRVSAAMRRLEERGVRPSRLAVGPNDPDLDVLLSPGSMFLGLAIMIGPRSEVLGLKGKAHRYVVPDYISEPI